MNIPKEFQVTEEHIENGMAESCRRCPVALAIREQFDHDYVEVYGDTALLWKAKPLINRDKSEEFNPHLVKRFLLDRNLIVWIRRFDKHLVVSPIIVRVDADKMCFEAKGGINE